MAKVFVAILTVAIIFTLVGVGIGLNFEKTSQKPTPVIVSTSSPVPSPIPERLLLDIPRTWKEYSKDFQGLHFRFSYPPEFTIFDLDPDSGNITLMKEKYALEIGRLSFYGIPEYTGGGRREWFVSGAKSVNLSLNISAENYNFILLEFSNGNSYYLVKEGKLVNGNLPWIVEKGSDFYFGIFNNKSILIRDSKIIPQKDVWRIMQTLKVE